jgi:hypothetical protein
MLKEACLSRPVTCGDSYSKPSCPCEQNFICFIAVTAQLTTNCRQVSLSPLHSSRTTHLCGSSAFKGNDAHRLSEVETPAPVARDDHENEECEISKTWLETVIYRVCVITIL